MLLDLRHQISAYVAKTICEPVKGSRPGSLSLKSISQNVKYIVCILVQKKPIWRKSNDVLDMSGVCSPIESMGDDEDNDADHFKVGGGKEGD